MKVKQIVTRVFAGVCTSSLLVTSIPATLTVHAAAWDDGSVNVMLDKGGYKTEIFGAGTYDWIPGIDRNGKLPPSTVYLTDKYKQTVGTVPTSDWASSVVFDQYSESLYAHPLAYRAASNGMQMANPAVLTVMSSNDGEPQVESMLEDSSVELVVGGSGFTAKDAKVDKTTDWTYDILMENAAGTASMMTTMSKGSPYAYYQFKDVTPQISLGAGATNLTIYQNSTASNQIGISVTNTKDNKTHYYGVYAPAGTTWSIANNALTANLPSGKNYLSVAALPDDSGATFADYAQYAYNFITNTIVEWDYNEETSKVITTYNFETTNMETGAMGGDTIMALYPHQYRYLSEGDLASYTYATIRGTMKTVVGSSYETEMTYTGILPVMPTLEEGKGTLTNQISFYWNYYKNQNNNTWVGAAEWQYGGYDTYWMGKNFNRLSDVIMMSSVMDDNDETMKGFTNDMVAGLKGQLEYWFDPYQGYNNSDNYFYYHKDYGTMIGYASGYGSDFEVNDHHFHYGYWIKAAATVAMMDETDTWEDEYGGMVYELIDDIANLNHDGRSHNNIVGKSDTKYPFLRNFDIYEGHSWASGVANYEYDANGTMIDPNGGLSGGNNQESSTEAVNAWASLILWGEAVGDEEIRDLGVYLYTTEVAAIEDYYYDIYDEIFTDEYKDKGGYNIQTVTRLFAGRYDHTAWWTEDPIEVTTISMLPMTGATLFLARNKEKVKEVYDSISPSSKQWTEYVANKNQICANYGKADMLTDPYTHQDILAEYYALYDPQAAMSMWSIEDINGRQYMEFGDSRAHTYGYIQSMIEYGTPNLEVTGSTPFSMVFEKNGVRTYVAYNASHEAERVYFSDGAYIDVEAGKFYTGAKMGNETNPDAGVDASKATYKVEHYKENVNGEYELADTDKKTGKIDTTVNASARTYAGYTLDKTITGTIERGTVSADGSLVLKLFYTKNSSEDTGSEGGGTGESGSEGGGTGESGSEGDETGGSGSAGESQVTLTGKGCIIRDGKLILYVADMPQEAAIVGYYKVYNSQEEANRAVLGDLPGYNMTKNGDVWELECGTIEEGEYLVYAFNKAGWDTPIVSSAAEIQDADKGGTIGKDEKPGDGGTTGEDEKPGDGETTGEDEKPGDGGTTGEDEKPGDSGTTGEDEKPGDGETTKEENKPTKDNVAVRGVILNKNTLELIEGNSEVLIATIVPANATNQKVEWITTEPEVANVDANGKVTAVKAGTAFIYVKTQDGNKETICSVNVSARQSAGTEVKVNKIKITGISKKIAAGKKVALTAQVTPSNSTNQAVVWSTSNDKYATVSNKGVVTLKKAGAGKTVDVKATAVDGSGVSQTYKIRIMKKAVTKVKVTAPAKNVNAGKSLTLKANVTAKKGANKILMWKSSNSTYATVNKNGVVKTKKAGKGKTVKITAMSTDGSNKKATIKIKIH